MFREVVRSPYHQRPDATVLTPLQMHPLLVLSVLGSVCMGADAFRFGTQQTGPATNLMPLMPDLPIPCVARSQAALGARRTSRAAGNGRREALPRPLPPSEPPALWQSVGRFAREIAREPCAALATLGEFEKDAALETVASIEGWDIRASFSADAVANMTRTLKQGISLAHREHRPLDASALRKESREIDGLLAMGGPLLAFNHSHGADAYLAAGHAILNDSVLLLRGAKLRIIDPMGEATTGPLATVLRDLRTPDFLRAVYTKWQPAANFAIPHALLATADLMQPDVDFTAVWSHAEEALTRIPEAKLQAVRAAWQEVRVLQAALGTSWWTGGMPQFAMLQTAPSLTFQGKIPLLEAESFPAFAQLSDGAQKILRNVTVPDEISTDAWRTLVNCGVANSDARGMLAFALRNLDTSKTEVQRLDQRFLSAITLPDAQREVFVHVTSPQGRNSPAAPLWHSFLTQGHGGATPWGAWSEMRRDLVEAADGLDPGAFTIAMREAGLDVRPVAAFEVSGLLEVGTVGVSFPGLDVLLDVGAPRHWRDDAVEKLDKIWYGRHEIGAADICWEHMAVYLAVQLQDGAAAGRSAKLDALFGGSLLSHKRGDVSVEGLLTSLWGEAKQRLRYENDMWQSKDLRDRWGGASTRSVSKLEDVRMTITHDPTKQPLALPDWVREALRYRRAAF